MSKLLSLFLVLGSLKFIFILGYIFANMLLAVVPGIPVTLAIASGYLSVACMAGLMWYLVDAHLNGFFNDARAAAQEPGPFTAELEEPESPIEHDNVRYVGFTVPHVLTAVGEDGFLPTPNSRAVSPVG